MFTEHRFISFDKTPIFYRLFATPLARKASIIIVHGMGEHGGRYSHVAQALNQIGFDVYAPDIRGFGKSGGNKACVKNFSDFHRDLSALHVLVENKHKDKPVFLMGHSFGGLLVSSYSAFTDARAPRGLILSSPLFGISIPVPRLQHALALAASYVLPDLTQASKINPAWLTHDEHMLSVYKQDKLVHYLISTRFYRLMREMLSKAPEIASKISVPTLILQAGEDKIVSKEASIDFFNKLASKNKEIEVYPNCFHELFNETNRQIVLSRLENWLKNNV